MWLQQDIDLKVIKFKLVGNLFYILSYRKHNTELGNNREVTQESKEIKENAF